MFKIFSGAMKSSKSSTLINKADKLSYMNRNYKVFYPNSCSNGTSNAILSRANISIVAIGIDSPFDIYNYIDNTTQDILIDEAQFLANSDSEIEDFIMLIRYCEINNINICVAMLDLNYKNEPFPVFSAISAYADKIIKFTAVCEICRKDNARKPLRLRNNKPCGFNEEVLIDRSNNNVIYKSVCNECFHKAYKGLK